MPKLKCAFYEGKFDGGTVCAARPDDIHQAGFISLDEYDELAEQAGIYATDGAFVDHIDAGDAGEEGDPRADVFFDAYFAVRNAYKRVNARESGAFEVEWVSTDEVEALLQSGEYVSAGSVYRRKS